MKFCLKCGKQLSDDAAFCVSCGAQQQIEQSEDSTQKEPKSEEKQTPTERLATSEIPSTEESSGDVAYVGKTCPFCKTEIVEYDEVVVCPACEIAHHKLCWEENGGCTTFGCLGKKEGTVICINCGADIQSHEMFCTKCGTPKPMAMTSEPTVTAPNRPAACPSCGAGLEPSQEFCSKCGRKISLSDPSPAPLVATALAYPATAKKKKPKVIVATIASVAVIISIVCGLFVKNASQKKIESYMLEAESFSKMCIECGSDLEDLGNEIKDYWGEYVYSYGSSVYYHGHYMSSIDDAVAYALYDNASTVRSIKNQWSLIESKYKLLQDVPSKDEDIQSLYRAVKNVYEEMQGFYACVMEVSGNYSSFKSRFSAYDSSVASALVKLNDQLNNN